MKARSLLYYDTANLFGMIPLKRLGKGVDFDQEYAAHTVFQFVVTTPPDTITWRIVRTIESIYYFHPNAKVIVHSNTTPQRDSRLDIFAETGYDFEIRTYSFEALFQGAPFIDEEAKATFMYGLKLRSRQQYWYTHEADLVKMLVLEQNGGVMMDTDMHLIKPLAEAFTNAASWKDASQERVGTAMLIFEQNNPFLRIMLKDAIDIANNSYNRGKRALN